jgi:prophage maintenance system killer protein
MLDFLTIFHYNFVRIHPFQNNNGRTLRLMMCLFLLRSDYPPTAIEPEDRQDYMAHLLLAQVENVLNPLARFLGYCLIKSYHKYGEWSGNDKCDLRG